jgi:hypothetical protein
LIDPDEHRPGDQAVADVMPEYAETVVDPHGFAHVIPHRVINLGIEICAESYDPFDPSDAPSAGAMARAYIAMASALGSLPRPPKS